MRRSTLKRLSTAVTAALVTGLLVVAPTSAGAATGSVVFDDFEDGDTGDWGFFGGNAAGGGGGAAADRPAEGTYYFSTGWGGEGTDSGFYGGTFKNLDDGSQVALPAEPVFNMWVLNQSDATVDEYTLELTLREDTDGNGWTNGAEDSIGLNTTFASAQFDDTWTLLSAPLSSWSNLGTGGNGAFDGAVDEMVIVIGGVQGGPGTTVEVDFDTIAFTSGPSIVDDFESGVAPGTACPSGAPPLGFCTFNGAGSSVALTNPATPPAPELPEVGTPNSVLQMDVNSTSFAGFIHGFTNPAGDAWVSQDWSEREGISMWMYGENSGSQLFIDILDNRNPGSTTDDAERWSIPFVDDFSGWQLLEFPFADFTRKEIGNGAPNDGLGLFEMHGYALGALGSGGPRTFYVDNVALYGVGEPPAPAVSFAQQNTFVEEGTTGGVKVKLNRPLGPADPAQVSIDYATERSNATPDRDFTPTSGTLTFTNGGPSTLSFDVETFDNSKFTGDKQIVIRLTNPVDVERGALSQGSVLIEDNDDFDPKLLDDFEQGAYLWDADREVALTATGLNKGDAMARPEQDKYETVLEVNTPVVADIDVMGSTCNSGNGVIPVHWLSTPVFDATEVDHTTVRFGDAAEAHTTGKKKTPKRHVADLNGDGLKDMLFHFRAKETGYNCESTNLALTGEMKDGTPIIANGDPIGFGRDFPIAQDWTKDAGMSFWYYGTGSGDDVTVTLKENRAQDPGPDGWKLAWADEFDDRAGTPPNPANWSYELGDTTPDGKNGWGNEELQYYTDNPDNAATDGKGNLVITLDEADGSQECYYGPCEYESARLITQHKAEFAYGRVESRLQVPTGGDGLWPAFWSLGTDITYNPWPGAGEIDYMEYVSRLPNEIFGTIHGPGYAGGASFGNIYDFGQRVDSAYHTFAVEWEPNEIRWYVDDILYHQADPSDIAPNEWVFEKPFFMLLNFAIGGNFGGAIDPDNTYPQEYLVDYVRLYQGPDTAERWQTTFADTVAGWQQVTVPLGDNWSRSSDQPVGAPDDGLSLDEVWGYGFEFPRGGTASGSVALDLVTLDPKPKPATVIVANLKNGGEGSLRSALEEVATGGTIEFDSSLAGGTLNLTTGPLAPAYDVTIDASAAPGITIDGGGADRVLLVGAGTDVTVKHLTMTNGYGFQLAGGVLNNGTLTLDHATVTGNTMTTDAGDFWQGGGGIYSGDGATLTLMDSTVSDNASGWAGGGIYAFFNTTTTVVRSTISGNTTADVGGGLRTLGTAVIDNSTISGNSTNGWHGGAMFVTDGVASVSNSTVAGNTTPSGTSGGLFVGTFGDSSATLELRNTIVSGNSESQCFIAPFGAGAVALNSLGNNVFGDGSCNPSGSDIVADALLGPLGDNGGPTLTHALGAGSPAIDTADAGAAPATDQRGIARPQGAGPDVGSFELE